MKTVTVVKIFTTLALSLAFLTVLPAARADDYNQAIKLTVSKSVQIPGRVLPAGTYWFVLDDLIVDREVVEVFNSDRSILYARIHTIVTTRPEPTDKVAMIVAERGTMQPEAIVSWIYPGRNSGHQFVYPKPMQQELAKDKQVSIVSGD
jgi:hypothetical protein